MSSVVELYEALSTAPDDRTRARVIAEAFERLEDRYPHLPEMATQGHVRESELRLQKEIEQVQANLKLEIEQVQANLKLEIEQLRSELKRDIEQLRSELKLDIAQVKIDLLKWLVPLMFAQVAAIAALVKLL
ncbi:MAG: CCDC90 family protein [Chromatiales bacterium]|nr:CCDC90 family protein [Chromatiales bacterium]